MAQSAGFRAVPSTSDRIAMAPPANERASSARVSRRPSGGGPLRPSQVPVVPVAAGRRTGPAGQAPARDQQNRTGLPEGLRAGVERLSGRSLEDVRVHYNSGVPAGVGALASTRGLDIDLGPGQEHHLSHEAWHVVQQMQGRVKPTVQAKGLPVNADERLEREADRMGAKALSIGRSLLTEGPAGHVEGTAGTTTGHGGGSWRQGSTGVAQLTTNLRFDENVDGNSKITATQHSRAKVHQQAADWVFGNGGWKSVPDGTVINHSAAYDPIAQEILNRIHNKKLKTAAATVEAIFSKLKAHNNGIGKAFAKHAQQLDDVINQPAQQVDVDKMIDAFNYYIYKICDYPANLFVWPQRTGGDPDRPSGQYDNANAPDADWKVANPLISKKTRLSREIQRLTDARRDIANAF
jgi:hypothetical protein